MSRTLFGELLRVVGRYWPRYLLALGVVIMANVLQISAPLIFRRAVASGPTAANVWAWGLAIVGVATGSAVFRYSNRVLFSGISRDAERDLRAEIFGRLQEHGQRFFDRHRVGDLMSRLTNDVSVYRDVLGPGVMYPAYFLTLVAPTLVVLFAISPAMAWVAMAPIFVLPPLMLAARGLLYRRSIQVQAALGDLSTFAQEDFAGIRLIKGYAAEGRFAGRFRALCVRFFRWSLRLEITEGLFYPLLSLSGRMVTVALVALAGFIILDGFRDLGTGNVLSFMWLQSYILAPVLMLGWILPIYQRGRGAYARLVAIAEEPLEVSEREGAAGAIPPAPTLEFRDVTFSYAPDAYALEKVSFEVPGGGIVALTGPPGSGKTTLFKLINRDYELGRGEIRIAGRPLVEYPLEDLRRSVAVVEEDPFLFSKTLRENIALGNEEASDAEVDRAAREAQLAELIAQLPQGYETLVGERGVTLSGGEKQRVAIARALMIDAPILLLDDIFSALDAVTADRIFAVLKGLRGKKTILLATHRVSVLQRCDRVLSFSRGHIDTAGSHYAALVELDQLLKRRGR